MAKAAAKSKKTPPRAAPAVLHVEVLQNGATMLRAERPLKRSGVVALTNATSGAFALPHYPLPENKLEFLHFEKGQATLVVDHKWEGFATMKGNPVTIRRAEKGRHVVPLGRGDYASVSHDDLRIMVKVAPRTKPMLKVAHAIQKGYRRGVPALFFPTIEEKRSTLIAAVAAAVVLGGFVLGLLNRTVYRPQRLDEIAEDYMLPFVAPEHLRTAPEALQNNLDRKHAVRSTIDYYEAFTGLLMGWPEVESRFLYPTSVELYQRLHGEVARDKAEKIARQKAVDDAQGAKNGVGLVAIPAVVGESMGGSMLRVIDKIGIMQKGLADDLALKREVIQTFDKDPEYSFEEYKNVVKQDDRAAKYLAQIKPWERFTDEELMYNDAMRLAKRAEQKQARTTKHQELVTPLDVKPIGLPEGVKYASFAYEMDFMLADEKLNLLQASEYGTAKKAAPIVKEPLVGEIEPAVVEKFIKQNKFQLQLCYELALRRNEEAGGTMEWRWRIDSRGVISDVALVSSSIKDQRMAQCIQKKISTWRFPRPRRGSVEISYPFEFAPSKG